MARSNKAEAAAARAELAAAERDEREINADVNEAIARTDSEVFTEAMGDEPIGEDQDTSLEDMGEDLEGQELEPEGEGEPEPPQGAAGEDEPPPQEPPPPPQPSIPPRVLRETRERFREQESYLQQQIRDMQQQNRDLQMRIDAIMRQPPAAVADPAKAAPVKPDIFADQDGYTAYLEQQATAKAEARVNEHLAAFERRQQQVHEERLNTALRATARGPRGYEFNVAYDDLTALDKTPQNADLVRRLCAAPDPGNAILDWWEQTSNPEYIEYHRDQIRRTYGLAPNGGGRVNGRGAPQQQIRHEVRLPRSLSEAGGGRSQHLNDPEMWDGSEASVFDYGSRR